MLLADRVTSLLREIKTKLDSSMEFKSEPSDDSEYPQFCMICLDTSEDCTLFPANTHSLDLEFEHLTGISLQDEVHFVPQFCTQCAQRLSNVSKLRDRCLRAYHSLLGLVQNHNMITLENINTIDRTYDQLVTNMTKKSFKPDHCDVHVIEKQENDTNIRNIVDKNTKHVIGVEYCPEFKSDDFKEDFDSNVEFLDDDFDDEVLVVKNDGQDSDVESSAEYIIGSSNYDTDNSNYHTGMAIIRKIKMRNENNIDLIIDDKASKNKFNSRHETLSNIRVTSGETHSRNVKAIREFGAKRSISCGHCGVKLSDDRQYAEHMKTQHPGKRRAKRKGNTKCEECGRVFRAPILLREHMHQHTGVKLYHCDICGAGFSQNISKTLHIQRHHGNKKIFPCEVCHRPFSNPANLKRHMPTHEPVRQSYTCQKCSKSFTSKPGLDQHIVHVHNKVPWPKKSNRRRVPKRHSSDTSDIESARHK